MDFTNVIIKRMEPKELICKARSLIKKKGLYKGTIVGLQKLIGLALCALKIPIQDNFLYKVSRKSWRKALDVQFQIFSTNENYSFYRIKDIRDMSEVRRIVFSKAKAFLNSYEKLGYPFTAMFKELMTENAKVLQLAAGACPEIVHLVKELNFDYYVEDPLFPRVFSSIDLREVFKEEIKGFCDLPAETMWAEYQEFFDVIVCHNVLNHTYDPGKVIDSMSKMIKPDGLVFDFTMRQFVGYSHPGIIGHRALIRGYTSRGFEFVYSAVFKHLDSRSFPQKHRYYTVLRKKYGSH